jgi:hypothetical protein
MVLSMCPDKAAPAAEHRSRINTKKERLSLLFLWSARAAYSEAILYTKSDPYDQRLHTAQSSHSEAKPEKSRFEQDSLGRSASRRLLNLGTGWFVGLFTLQRVDGPRSVHPDVILDSFRPRT